MCSIVIPNNNHRFFAVFSTPFRLQFRLNKRRKRSRSARMQRYRRSNLPICSSSSFPPPRHSILQWRRAERKMYTKCQTTKKNSDRIGIKVCRDNTKQKQDLATRQTDSLAKEQLQYNQPNNSFSCCCPYSTLSVL